MSRAASTVAADGQGPGAFGPTLLAADSITKRFGGLVAVSDITFHVPERSIVSIIGPNGAGKTTFFNILTGFYRPTLGRVRFGEKTITTARPDQITALGVARTFQNIRLFATMTATENVMVGQHARMRECWPTITFSTALMVANRRMFWNVRAMPSAVILSGRTPEIVLPSNSMVPRDGV